MTRTQTCKGKSPVSDHTEFIKAHMRSMLRQANLEGLMLMKLEHELTLAIDNDSIIDKIADHFRGYAAILKL